MSATLGMKNTTVKMFGGKANVPNNTMAKLMYYLHCVVTVIQYENSVLTDYQNYDELSGKELLAVYDVAKLLNPSLFINAGIFILDQRLLVDTDNQFYEITDETVGVHVNQEIMIGGRSVKVLKIMACNMLWLNRNYYRPIQEIDSLIRDYLAKEQKTPITSPDYGSVPITMTCPYCEKYIKTKTEDKFQILACVCCLIFSIFYCCFQICREKNLCCCNTSHRCPNCGKYLGSYDAC
jgi:hypothetical protein